MVDLNVLEKGEEEELLKGLKKEETIKKEVSFSWDGSNLIVRFPKEIADFLNLNKENRFEKSIRFTVNQKEDGTIEKTFDIVDRQKPIRKMKNATKKEKNK